MDALDKAIEEAGYTPVKDSGTNGSANAHRGMLFGDLLTKDTPQTTTNFAKLAIEGNAPKFAVGVEAFLRATERGDRKEVDGVDLSKTHIVRQGDVAWLDCGTKGSFKLRNHAFGQLAREMSAPPGYLVTLPPTIAFDALEYGMRNKLGGGKRTLRVENDEVRAIVSAKYAPLDDRQACRLLYAALKKADRLEEAQIESWSAGTTSRMVVSFGNVVSGADKGYAHHGVGGEGLGLRAGIELRNGELANGALAVLAAMWRHWCSNGALIESSKWARRHMGDWEDQAEELAASLVEILETANKVLKIAQPKALLDVFKPEELWTRLNAIKLNKVEQKAAIQSILSEAFGLYTFTPEAVGTASTSAQREAADVMRALSEAKKADERDAVLAELKLPRELSQWDLINGVTAVGRDSENADRAQELEALGGKLLANYLN